MGQGRHHHLLLLGTFWPLTSTLGTQSDDSSSLVWNQLPNSLWAKQWTT